MGPFDYHFLSGGGLIEQPPELDRNIGTWSAEQEAEVLQAVEIFERTDESFWA